MLQKTISTSCVNENCREGMEGLRITTACMCVYVCVCAQEEELESQIYFLKLTGLKDTAGGHGASNGSCSSRADLLCFVFTGRFQNLFNGS